MARIYTVLINNKVIEVAQSTSIGLRLDRMVQSATNFGSKGGDSSLSFNIPRTKNNNLVMGVNYGLGGINKFNALTFYSASILMDGSEIFSGVFKLGQITKNDYIGEFVSSNIDWVSALDRIQLCKLGYVDNVPTWTAPYVGGSTINSVNNMSNTQTDFICPTIVYNNTLQADYKGFLSVDVYGSWDGAGAQVSSPLSFPDEFSVENAYFGNRLGLTFEDFPPALYYSNVIQKCFDEIGYNAKGQIFDEEWFNHIYMPYVGEGYQFNWATLGSLFVKPTVKTYVFPTMAVDGLYFENFGLNYAYFSTDNVPKFDNTALRIDPVANFKKLQVTDDNVEYMQSGGFVAPISGRYRIKVKSYYKKRIQPNTIGQATDLDGFGNGVPGFGWDDNVVFITRRNESGDYVFEDEWRKEAARWMNQTSNVFVQAPNDVVAYFSPKRYDELGPTDINTSGSPLSDWEEVVTVNSSTHTIIANTNVDKDVEDFVDFEIDIQLLKNERINMFWFSVFSVDFGFAGPTDWVINDTNSTFEIEYLCGTEDLDLASNLPCDSCKELVSGFVNQFNLLFDVTGANTVEFTYDNSFFGNNKGAYPIDAIVDVDTVVITQSDAPKSLTIGYVNDDNDYLLMFDIDGCTSTSQQASNYGNVAVQTNDNKYATNDISITNGFSATKFVTGKVYFTDTTNGSWGSLIAPTIQTPPNYPLVGATTIEYFEAVGVQPLYFYELPSIQSLQQFNVTKLVDLEYEYNYTPRLLYHLGTSESYLGLSSSWKIRLNSPETLVMFDVDKHWIQTTVSAFDMENANPYPTLRYDTANGLYTQYFDDIVTLYNSSYILECDAWLRPIDWLRMKPSTIIKYQDNLYRLMSIGEFDPLGQVPSKLTLLKLI